MNILCVFMIMVTGITLVSSNVCTDSHTTSCSECIATLNCAWCFDPKYADNPNVYKHRCNLVEDLRLDGCSENFISNPSSNVNVTMNDNLSTKAGSSHGSATQIKPQKMEVKLRPGDPVNINFTFKLVEDYPVDLYYLLDLSSSMQNDLVKLRALGKQLGESMKNITKDLQMGFGSFVDKTLVPYIFTSESKLQNPCNTMRCVPTYSFHNDLPLTRNVDDFVASVKGVAVSSNIDHAEGGLDAMMQAIVCTSQIKWRSEATHLLVFSTDAAFHMAGDGRLAGVVAPNDGNCYLDSEGNYTKATEMDYPSVGHIVQKINKHQIQPIFAVTSNVISTFQNLQKMIPKSVVGHLTDDSSNIIGLIEDAYNSLKGKIIIEVKAPKGITISHQMSNCSGTVSEGLECDNVKLLDQVSYAFSMSTDTCLAAPVVIEVSAYGYNDVLSITVLPQCECQCEDLEQTTNCSGHGTYECGACSCDPGFTGLDCSCVQEQATSEELEDYIQYCTDPDTQLVCNGLGNCQCGKCICRQRPGAKIDGKYCQCDNTTCDREQGRICNDAGSCNCGKCECNTGWSGDRCECTLDTASCMDASESALDPNKPCNGNGECKCGSCECHEASSGGTYRGSYCQTSPLVACKQHEDCIGCLAFGTGKYSDPALCRQNCANYNVSKLNEDASSSYAYPCRFTDEDDCSFSAYFEEKDGVIFVDVEPQKDCKEYVNPIHIIIGIIGAIVGIGLAILLLWKLLTSIKDAREFKNFQKESQNAKWQADENPIYKKATSTFRNPMYTGGNPSSGH